MSLQTCTDISEASSLEETLGLYLKPASKIKISVQMPSLKTPGQSLSSWQIMEKLKAAIRPNEFLYLKALKITSTLIKFEGELETKAVCDRALSRLQAAGGIKLAGFTEFLQIRAAKLPSLNPSRHDWEAFFRDARGVDEMKPGERPDTVYISDLPVRWFSESGHSEASEKFVRKAFGTFGRIRRLEIPKKQSGEVKTFGKVSSLHHDLAFEVYIQYEEYVEFATAIDSLRGKKLIYKDSDGKAFSVDIKVDFDRTGYLSDRCIKQRAVEAEKLEPQNSTVIPGKNKDSEKPQQNNSRADSSALKKKKAQSKEEKKPSKNEIEAKYLLKELLGRAEASKREIDLRKKEAEIAEERAKQQRLELQKLKEEAKRKRLEERKKKERLIEQERILKEKLLRNVKARENRRTVELREKLRKELAGRKVLKSVLVKSGAER